jgi:LPPG:FO 2-phospho-L-lactate transferase
MAMMKKLGGETWFQLGDHDLAVHTERSRRLAAGQSLSSITERLCAQLGVTARVVPMSDDPVRTVVVTDRGELAFQDYFVRLKCEPVLKSLRFDGIAQARASAGFTTALDNAEAIVICPSNPYLSVQPILELPGIAERLRARKVPVAAISPIVGGRAIKGPAAKILRELGHEATALEVARHYRGLVDLFVLDNVDAALADEVKALGLRPLVTDTIMRDTATAATLSQNVLDALRA